MPMITGSDTRMYSPRSESNMGYSKDDDDYKYGAGDPEHMEELKDKKMAEKDKPSEVSQLPHLQLSIPKPELPQLPGLMEEEEDPLMMDDQFNEGQQFGAMTGMPDMGNLSIGNATGTMPAPGGMLATGEPMENAWSTLMKEDEEDDEKPDPKKFTKPKKIPRVTYNPDIDINRYRRLADENVVETRETDKFPPTAYGNPDYFTTGEPMDLAWRLFKAQQTLYGFSNRAVEDMTKPSRSNIWISPKSKNTKGALSSDEYSRLSDEMLARLGQLSAKGGFMITSAKGKGEWGTEPSFMLTDVPPHMHDDIRQLADEYEQESIAVSGAGDKGAQFVEPSGKVTGKFSGMEFQQNPEYSTDYPSGQKLTFTGYSDPVQTGEPMDDAWSSLIKSRLDRIRGKEQKPFSREQFEIQPGGADITTANTRRAKRTSRQMSPMKNRGLDLSPHSVDYSHLGIKTKQPLRLFPRDYDQQLGTQQKRQLLANVPQVQAGHALGPESRYNPKPHKLSSPKGRPIREPGEPKLRGQKLSKSANLLRKDIEDLKKKVDYMKFNQIRRLLTQLKNSVERQERRLKAANQGGHGNNREAGHMEAQNKTTKPTGATESMDMPDSWGAPSTMFAARGSGRVG